MAPRGWKSLATATWDAVLLDQRMPGMDGLETLRQLKERDLEGRIIMITAYASIELAVEAMKLGATDFVRKPMTPETCVTLWRRPWRKRPWSSASRCPLPRHRRTPPHRGAHHERFPHRPLVHSRTWRAAVPGENSGGMEQEVGVDIDAEAVAMVERLTRRRLPFESSFWTMCAERTLAPICGTRGSCRP